jgi:hypothetical protein
MYHYEEVEVWFYMLAGTSAHCLCLSAASATFQTWAKNSSRRCEKKTDIFVCLRARKIFAKTAVPNLSPGPKTDSWLSIRILAASSYYSFVEEPSGGVHVGIYALFQYTTTDEFRHWPVYRFTAEISRPKNDLTKEDYGSPLPINSYYRFWVPQKHLSIVALTNFRRVWWWKNMYFHIYPKSHLPAYSE